MYGLDGNAAWHCALLAVMAMAEACTRFVSTMTVNGGVMVGADVGSQEHEHQTGGRKQLNAPDAAHRQTAHQPGKSVFKILWSYVKGFLV